MTAEVLLAADPVVSLLVGCQHLTRCVPMALAWCVWEASQTLIQIAFCFSPLEVFRHQVGGERQTRHHRKPDQKFGLRLEVWKSDAETCVCVLF